jgi:hypothetical protein
MGWLGGCENGERFFGGSGPPNESHTPLTCAPTTTRTRDLVLRRHFRNVAWRCHMWPDVLFRYRENGWMWPVAALSL